MRYALLICRHEDTAVSDREKDRHEEQFTAILDGLPARGVLAGTQRLLSARAARIVRCRDGGTSSSPTARPPRSFPISALQARGNWFEPSCAHQVRSQFSKYCPSGEE
jgi:hypothetical protein